MCAQFMFTEFSVKYDKGRTRHRDLLKFLLVSWIESERESESTQFIGELSVGVR